MTRFNTSRIYHGGGIGRGSYSGASVDTDVKVKASVADTTPSFLMNDKIIAGGGILLTLLNPGGNEQVQISAPGSTSDEKVKVSAADTTPNFLINKCSLKNLSSNILNPGANELYELVGGYTMITGADTTKDWLAAKIATGGTTGIIETILNPAGNEQLQLAHDGKFLVSADDTTRKGLEDSLVAGTNIVLTTQNPAGNENIKIDASGGGSAGETIDLHFATAAGLGQGSLIPQSFDGGSPPGGGHGYYLGHWKIKEVHALLNRFTAYSTGTLTIDVREAGSLPRGSPVTFTQGFRLLQFNITANSTGGGFNYYKGYSAVGLNILVTSGEMMFCSVWSKTLNSCTGVSVHVILERVPA